MACEIILIRIVLREAGVNLVITRPKHYRGMTTKLSYYLSHLIFEVFHKLCRFGILSARHREVLPHHNAVAIAEVEELVILVDVSAPATKNVASYILNEREGFGISFSVARMEGVKGYPV